MTVECHALIGGRYVETNQTFQRRNPATGEIACVVDVADADTVDAAVVAARAAFADWGRTTGKERGRLLRRLGAVVDDARASLAEMITSEQGKPFDEASGEVAKFADAMRFYGEEAERIRGETIPNDSNDFLSVIAKEPVGVVAAIVPWNYPAELAGWKLGAALGAGCTIVLKSSEHTPGTVHLIGELVSRAGIPDGVVNIVHGAGETGATLAGHPDIDKVAFTGSYATGLSLFRSVSKVVPLTMELGGSCPMIVSRHADLDLAAQGAARRSFRNAGQICIAINRVYVESAVADDFVARLADRVSAMTVANGLENPAADMGPVAMPDIRDRTRSHIDDALERGGRLATDGPDTDLGGLFMRPTVVADAPADSLLMTAETFGPTVGVATVPDLDAAVARANEVPGGLAAYVFTERLDESIDLGRRLDFGNVAVNNVDAGIMNAPYGGRRQAGFGYEHAKEGLEGYLQLKHLRLRHTH